MSCENLVIQSATKKQAIDILSEVATVEGKIDTISTSSDDIEAKIDVIDSNVDTLNVDVTNIEAKVDIIDTNVDVVNGKIGEDTDEFNGTTTLKGFNNTLYKHIHNPSYLYPSNGTNISVTTSATTSQFGAMVEVIPANAITEAFDIHWANIADMTAVGTYNVELWEIDGSLAPVKYLGVFSATRNDNFSKVGESTVQIPPVAPNTRIGARALKGTSGTGTISFNIHYHDYGTM